MTDFDFRRSVLSQIRRVESDDEVRNKEGFVGCHEREEIEETWPDVCRKSRMYMSPLTNSPLSFQLERDMVSSPSPSSRQEGKEIYVHLCSISIIPFHLI